MTNPDADALFARASTLPPPEARPVVEQAADLGHPVANAWLAVDDVVRQHDTGAAVALAAPDHPEQAPDGVVIRPQRFHATFGQHFDDGWAEIDPAYLVVSPDARAAARVLQRASGRLMAVTYEGTDLAADDDTGEEYTPNYVSSPRMAPDGASIWLDCKGEVSEGMAARMLEIVVEEMSRARIVGVLAVPVDSLTRPEGPAGELPWPDVGIDAGPGPYDWALARVVMTDEPGVQWEYRAADGSWSRDVAVADRRPVTTDDAWDALSDDDLQLGWAEQDRPTPPGRHGPAWMLVASTR